MALHVTVTTAVELTADLRKQVTEIAREKANTADIELKEVVDPGLVGGVRLTIGSQQYDASVAGTLEMLRNLA